MLSNNGQKSVQLLASKSRHRRQILKIKGCSGEEKRLARGFAVTFVYKTRRSKWGDGNGGEDRKVDKVDTNRRCSLFSVSCFVDSEKQPLLVRESIRSKT